MESMEGLKGQKILVTGGTGFVGSHVVEELLRRGTRVIIPFRSLDPQSYFSLENLESRVVLAVADLKDPIRVLELVVKYEVDYIFHLAAQALVTVGFDNPWETMATNVMGTVNILEAARRSGGVKGIIAASSDKAYGKSDQRYHETDALRGDHPYEASKSAMDLICQAYFKTYGLPIVITRFGNIYGPGDNNLTRIIPGIMQTTITGEELVLRSDGSYIREYMHVNDVALAYMFLLSKLESISGEAFNVSSGLPLSVLGLIRKVQKTLRKKIPYRIANTAKNEIPRQRLSGEKIRKLGWRPTYSIERGLKLTYRWYRRHKEIFF